MIILTQVAIFKDALDSLMHWNDLDSVGQNGLQRQCFIGLIHVQPKSPDMKIGIGRSAFLFSWLAENPLMLIEIRRAADGVHLV